MNVPLGLSNPAVRFLLALMAVELILPGGLDNPCTKRLYRYRDMSESGALAGELQCRIRR